MGRVEVDFTDVEGGFDALPEGSNPKAVVENISKGMSQRSGEPMITFEYKVTEGKHKGTIVMDFCSLQKQALFRLKQRLNSLGYEVPNGPLAFDTDDLLGLPVRLQVGPPRKDDQGNWRTNLLAVALDEGEGAEVETAEAPVAPAPMAKRRPGGRPVETSSEGDEPAPFEKKRPGAAAEAPETVAKPRRVLNVSRL